MPGDLQDALGASGGAARTPGRVVGGRYRLDRVLGRGGMGVVWAALDELLAREVAVKEVLAPSGLDDAQRALLRSRTLREARTAARISVEGAVAILDVVEDDGRPWIVMERLPPRTLEDELTERGGIPPREVAEIAASLLAGLTAAHAAGILHRDVKPSNVMFRDTPRGRRAVLADFGIAHVDGDATLTATGQLMGSPAYIAPERARGEGATTASDLWSLGVTLWAAVEGWSPFQRVNSLASLTAVITEEPPPAPHAGPLRPLLDGLLRKDPADRMDAAACRRLLDEVLAPVAPVTRAIPLPASAAPEPPAPGEPVPPPSVAPPSIPRRVTTGTRPMTVPPVPPLTADPVPPVAPAAADPVAPAAVAPVTGDPVAPDEPWWAPAPSPAPDGGGEERRHRGRRVVQALAAVVVVGLVGLGARALGTADDPASDAAGPQTSATGDAPQPEATQPVAGDPGGSESAAPEDGASVSAGSAPEGSGAGTAGVDTGTGGSGAPTAGAGADGSGDAGGTDPAQAQAAAVPAGFELFSDPSGFSVAVPVGWQAEREGPRVYLHDPASAAYLLVDQTDDPAADPVADWQQQEPAVADRLEGYTRIGEIEPVDFRGWQAADWEFVFGPGQGTHVLNRNVITSPDQAYALYWSVPSSRWDAMLPVHEQVVASFRPAG